MFEIKDRDGLARVGKWEPDGHPEVQTPVVMFVPGPGSYQFPPSEMELTGDLGIPDGMSCPMTFMDRVDGDGLLGGDGRVLLVGPAPPKEVPTSVELVVSGNVQTLVGNPKRLVAHLVGLREAIGYSRLLYATAVGDPETMALLCYLGVDVFDSVPLAFAARRGLMMFPEGTYRRDEVALSGMCHCPACSGEFEDDHRRGLLHNHHMALQETRRVRHAISTGTIRELVETRVRAAPWMVAALRELDLRHHAVVERHIPISKPFMLATSRESLHRPEVVRFQNRLRERYARPPSASIALLLPCSARKPYSGSSTHRAIWDALSGAEAVNSIHRIVVTSPLGVVPMELEGFYPANVYDIAVTGDWDLPEIEMIREGVSWLLGQGGYKAVVSYIDGMPFIKDVVEAGSAMGSVLHPKDPRRKDDLDELVEVIGTMARDIGLEKVIRGRREAEDLASYTRFQFGAGGETLVTRVRRLRDHVQLYAGDDMTGTLGQDRGLVSLTLKGGERLLALGRHVVEIEDFEPKGTVFSVGVKGADQGIRPGDDCVVARDGELVGVGVAQMSGLEMVGSKRGGAVRLRHRVK